MFKRERYISRLMEFKDTDFIKVITGVRRSGKSVLLQLYADKLQETGVDKEQIIYINFEEFDYQTVRDEMSFRELIKNKIQNKNKKIYFLIDEIQFVNGWQNVVNSIRVTFDCDIVVTGSNANMLSGELATFLSGRYVELPVYPLSFEEYLDAKNIDKNSRYIDEAYRDYEKYGAFPGVVVAGEIIKDTILSGIYDSIVLNDISFRSGIRDVFVLKRLIAFLADNVGQLVNPSRIANVFKNEKIDVSSHTIDKYLALLENAYLFYKVRQYDIRGKEYLKTSAKYFIVDNGLRRHAVGMKEGNHGNRLENIVFVELLRRGYTVDVGRVDAREIDFIARKLDEIIYIQVTYELPENTHESDNLLAIKNNYKKIIITGRYNENREIDGVEIIYIVDWLLGKY